MAKEIFVNLPVKNLDNSMTFFKELGFSFDPKFTDDKATCMIIGENIYAMLLVEEFFESFSVRPICNAKEHTEVLICISLDSRKAVDDMVERAIAAGGSYLRKPQDYGWMYGYGFQDLDGHGWEVVYMDTSKMPDKGVPKDKTVPMGERK